MKMVKSQEENVKDLEHSLYLNQFREFKEQTASQRFVTIDFLRGVAIFLMLFLHTLMRVYDRSWVGTPAMANASLSLILFLVLCVSLGGWCGFFLLISSIGNTISMQKQMDKGKPLSEILARQLLGGVLLLFFAVLTESTIGYHGYLGSKAGSIDQFVLGNFVSLTDLSLIFYRGYHMETIHAVAWCVIINGAIHTLLSRKSGKDKIRRNQLIYLGLTVVVIVITPYIWDLAAWIVEGYPFGRYEGSGRLVQYPLEGTSTLGDYIKLFFLMPLAGHPEPLFPFLAVSFLGSMFGLELIKEKPSKKFVNIGLILSVFFTIAGFIGLGWIIAGDLGKAGLLLAETWNIPKLENMWVWWFFVVTGSQVFVTLLFLRLVEFRGKTVPFAKATLYFRRYGIVAFSIYNYQFIDVFPRYFLGLILGVDLLHTGASGPLSVIVVIGVFITWSLVLRLWEKVHFIGGLEWFIGSFSSVLLGKKKVSSSDEKMTQDPKMSSPFLQGLNTEKLLYQVQWVEIRTYEDIDHSHAEDSKLALCIAIIGLVIPVFAYFSIDILIDSRKSESTNIVWKIALILSIFDVFLFIGLLIGTSMISGIVL